MREARMREQTLHQEVRISAFNAASGVRIRSLDVFRGGTVAAMVVVNNPGTWDAVYPPLLHSHWHGCTFTDLVFPFFLWIVGVAMTFSYAKRIAHGDDRGKLLAHTLLRAAGIYGIGIILTILTLFSHGILGSTSPQEWRFGTLQHIATCYLVAAIVFLLTSWRGQLAAIMILLATYWILMSLGPVPGYEQNANFASYFGQLTQGWDLIGITTLPAIATTLFGCLTGHILRSEIKPPEKAAWIFFAGAGLLFTGYAMTAWMPLNKQLWTSSYSVFTAGLASLVFASCYWLIDVNGKQRAIRPFTILGMNALVIYALSELLIIVFRAVHVSQLGQSVSLQSFVYQLVFAPLMSPPNASLLWAFTFLVILYWIAWVMFRKQWFVKL